MAVWSGAKAGKATTKTLDFDGLGTAAADGLEAAGRQLADASPAARAARARREQLRSNLAENRRISEKSKFAEHIDREYKATSEVIGEDAEAPGSAVTALDGEQSAVSVLSRGPGSQAHKAARWTDYQARGGGWDYARWSAQYETNMRNPAVGLGREAMYREATGGESRVVKTPYGDRQIDVMLKQERLLVQVKTGPQALTTTGRLANTGPSRKTSGLWSKATP